ncbi:hypothetical protein D8B46_02335 [Candidatus Gracilibacteria bacterium]|nr:MAG: hypothetical protein D8B46_02335 [Candidatus Gracilibacteria bacterium]
MRKLSCFLGLFLFFSNVVFSYEAQISSDKEELEVGETLRLEVNLKNLEELGKVEISKINGIENFDVIGSSQSSKIISQSKVVDGKFEEQREAITSLVLTLEPKKAGSFSLGPVVLDNGTEKKETNSLKINVSKSKIKPKLEDKNEQKRLASEENFQKQYSEKLTKTDNTLDNKIYFIIILAFLTLFLIVIIIMKVYLSRKGGEKELNKDLENKQEQENIEEEIVELPDVEDEKFIEKIEKILKKEISLRFNLKFKDKDISDIFKEIDFSNNKDLEEINALLNKSKYSNLELDKTEILEKVKSFLNKK